MMRNMELIDRILLAVEAAAYDAPLRRADLPIEGFDADAVRYNLGLAISKGLVVETSGTTNPAGQRWAQGETADGLWLTWEGHQHLDDRGIART